MMKRCVTFVESFIANAQGTGLVICELCALQHSQLVYARERRYIIGVAGIRVPFSRCYFCRSSTFVSEHEVGSCVICRNLVSMSAESRVDHHLTPRPAEPTFTTCIPPMVLPTQAEPSTPHPASPVQILRATPPKPSPQAGPSAIDLTLKPPTNSTESQVLFSDDETILVNLSDSEDIEIIEETTVSAPLSPTSEFQRDWILEMMRGRAIEDEEEKEKEKEDEDQAAMRSMNDLKKRRRQTMLKEKMKKSRKLREKFQHKSACKPKRLFRDNNSPKCFDDE
nr:TPA_asm: oncoid [Ladona dragonfly adintovirus]